MAYRDLEKRRAWARAYYKKFGRRYWAQQLQQRRERRTKALSLLGGKCVRCGFDDPRALQIDHVNGDGAAERKARRTPRSAELNVVKGEYGPYQLLCANCNWIKRAEREEHTPCQKRSQSF